ncbi:MAG: hypothetical protein OJI67_09780 [Prosthecobacter sp.]|nr:hypothetical protein [Prosthecobacter sp.]
MKKKEMTKAQRRRRELLRWGSMKAGKLMVFMDGSFVISSILSGVYSLI